ncbi:MAG TPA: elongation factor P maturation arginine rhamnosyltransferase EarP [Burkholderiaceae bacterium]|nr:elongation factor P maturation arginine rhamnosyltransferase EarP [Burkholderiaceae bacterium]
MSVFAGSDAASAASWWILCRVVDNFGDAGVCWRLARQLALEQHAKVTLFIDRPELVSRLSGGATPTAGLAVRAWTGAEQADLLIPDVIVSAFGCELPAWLRAHLAGAPARPLWINLEYLSAEPWVDGCHGLASVKPQDGAVEHFFFPGFTAHTGGLLRERDALATETPPPDDARARALKDLCDPLPEPGERVISLFCYPEAPLDAWLHALTRGERNCLLLVPEGVADAALERFIGEPLRAPAALRPTSIAALAPGAPPLRRGRLRIARIPFLPQRRYDELLRLCDLNFVRGEDSWIRAHWARRPFVWQPYVQDDGAHLVKLDAFLSRFGEVAGAAAATSAPASDPAWTAIDAMMRTWSGQGDPAAGDPAAGDPAAGDPVAAWHRFEARLETIAPCFRDWTDSLLAHPDLASTLFNWAQRKL